MNYWMVCNNCGHKDYDHEGKMYECPKCGWGDGWGAEDRADADRRSAEIRARGRLDAPIVRDPEAWQAVAAEGRRFA